MSENWMDYAADEIERLKDENERLQESARPLVERLNVAESVLLTAKIERECATLDDWRLRAQYYEYQWGICSAFANREIPKWQLRAETAESLLDEIAGLVPEWRRKDSNGWIYFGNGCADQVSAILAKRKA